MKKILLFVALVAVGITAATRSTSGTKGDTRNDASVKLLSTYYASKWKGVPIQPADADFMFAYTYLISGNTATLMSGPNYAVLALSANCRYEWLNSKIDPSCTSGCRTWSYYYSPASSFTSTINYLAVACPDAVDF